MRQSLRLLVPRIPLADAQDVLERAGGGSMRGLSPNAAVWLALTSHIRHRYTTYDTLLSQGYDRDAARFFVVEDTGRQLTEWGCARPLIDDTED